MVWVRGEIKGRFLPCPELVAVGIHDRVKQLVHKMSMQKPLTYRLKHELVKINKSS